MKALWMATDSNKRQGDLVHVIYDILSSPQCNSSTRITLVDVSRTRSTIWPLVFGFTSAFPQYRAQIKWNPPAPLSKYLDDFSKRPLSFGVSAKWDVSPREQEDNMDVRFYLLSPCSHPLTIMKDNGLQAYL
jgi:hypothetical protein